MRVLARMLAGGAFAAALVGAAPAAAQYYPGYPGGGYGYGGYGYGANSQAAVGQCTAAVQQRLNGGDYGYSPYGYNGGYGGYGYNGYGYGPRARVLGVSRVEPSSSGGLTVRGVATSGRYGGYGDGGYGGEQRPDLVWKCRTDYRGFITDVDVDPAQRTYGGYRDYGYDNYSPYNGYENDYSQYGYRRY